MPVTHMEQIKLGIYRHFKGGQYRVLALARHSESLEPMVVYQALYGRQESLGPSGGHVERGREPGRRAGAALYLSGANAMKILIDADGCPVVGLTVELAKKYAIDCIILCDTAHTICYPGVQTEVYDKGADSVDFALVNQVEPGDLLSPEDYGLAAMCLSRRAAVISRENGLVYLRQQHRRAAVKPPHGEKNPQCRRPSQGAF